MDGSFRYFATAFRLDKMQVVSKLLQFAMFALPG